MTEPTQPSLFAAHPGKRAAERFFLAYTPVWGVLAASVMLTGVANRWGDVELLAFALLLSAGTAAGAYVFAPAEEKAKPLRERYATKILVWLAIYSFLANTFGTSFFYEALHAHYGFDTRFNLNGVPVFLTFMTITYFATYSVLACMGWRFVRDRVMPRSRVKGCALAFAVPVVIAGVESLLNANPWMKTLYCFDHPAMALTFGTVAYGTWLALAMPFWVTLDERPGDDSSMRKVIAGSLLATALLIADAEFLKRVVAPHVTEVAWGHVGLRDYGTSCLGAAPEVVP
ncbi:MAG: hypothetical protein IPK07_27230 [Deltaproteobacteria bacterium]|nr:hypothetical protein [Deltaproteobacteria bacterium]